MLAGQQVTRLRDSWVVWPVVGPLGLIVVVFVCAITLEFFQTFRPDSWLSRSVPIKLGVARAEVTGEVGPSYHDDGNGVVYISYASPAQKYQAIQKWHADFPDRWNRQIWADAENGVLLITYVP